MHRQLMHRFIKVYFGEREVRVLLTVANGLRLRNNQQIKTEEQLLEIMDLTLSHLTLITQSSKNPQNKCEQNLENKEKSEVLYIW